MGCNTSKESVPAAEGQDKEKQENGAVNKAEDNNVGNSGGLLFKSFLCECALIYDLTVYNLVPCTEVHQQLVCMYVYRLSNRYTK